MKKITIKLKDILNQRGISQSDFAAATGIRPNAISNLCRNYVDRLNIEHIEKIMDHLQLEDIRELIHVETMEE